MEEDKLIESKKILTDYMLELNDDIQRAEDWVNTGADEEMYFALQTVLNELERLQKENDRYKRIKPIMLDGDYELNVEEFLEISDKLYNLQHDNTCLHCGKDTPLYCEKCQQELITKNAELQLKNEELITYCKKCIIIDRLNEYVENSIPKQDIKDKIEELYSYIEENSDEQGYWGDKNPEELYMEIHFLEELLRGE